jgi:hypothetical protein
MSRKNNSGLWEYLETLGVLENGTDEEIKAAKRAYRKDYLLKYKRIQRTRKPEFIINFSNEKGEFHRIRSEAKRHNMTITAFVKKAALAYLEQKFVVPNADQVARLEQAIFDCLNEVQSIVRTRERFFWDKERKFVMIEKRIEKLEAEINQVFRNPPLITIKTIKDCQ